MANDVITTGVRQFIFDYIDSVEQLEVLIFLRVNEQQWFSSESLNTEFRSSVRSIEKRLSTLVKLELIQYTAGIPPKYCYLKSHADDRLVEQLTNSYRLRKQAIQELIFSPLKKGRDFADAFIIKKKNSEDGDSNG